MNGKGSPPLREHPIRWTYDGTLDDMVTSYPWPGIPASDTKHSLDARLAYSVVAGTPILLNDGYLVLNQACFESLRDPYSPLRVLINERYVRVLSRNPARSLEEMVLNGARQGIKTYKDLLNNAERWSATLRILNVAEGDLRAKSAFIGWPRVDLASSYQQLIRSLIQLSPEELWQDRVPPSVFRRVAERFENEMNKEASKPRSKWEEIVKEEAETEADIHTMMQLANEVYHHNFGAALTARPPADMPEGAEVAVQSRVSHAFSGLYKSYTLRASPAASVVPEIVLPWGPDYSKPNLLVGLFDENLPVGACRVGYLNLRARYRAGEVGAEEMADKRDEYQRRLEEYLHPFIPTYLTNLAISAGVSAGVGWLTNKFVGPQPGSLIGVFTFLATQIGKQVGVPHIIERWRVGDLERKAILALKDLRKIVSNRRILTSLPVQPSEAYRLVGSLPELQ